MSTTVRDRELPYKAFRAHHVPESFPIRQTVDAKAWESFTFNILVRPTVLW